MAIYQKTRVNQIQSERYMKTPKYAGDKKLLSYPEIPQPVNFNNEDIWEPTEQEFDLINSHGGKE
jgi:hypothetical protein